MEGWGLKESSWFSATHIPLLPNRPTQQNTSPAPASPTSGRLRQVNTIELQDRPGAKQGLSAPFSR